jgi:hypothetical protein
VCGSGTHSQEGICIADVDVAGNAGLFVTLVLTHPKQLGGAVNSVVAAALESGDALILIGAHQPREDDLRIYGAPGRDNLDKTFSLEVEHAYEVAGTAAAAGITSEPFTWVVVGLTDQPLVFVDTVISEATISITGGARVIDRGTMTGVMTPENAEMVFLVPDLTLLEGLMVVGAQPDVDRDGDGDPESWEARAEFTTNPVWLF